MTVRRFVLVALTCVVLLAGAPLAGGATPHPTAAKHAPPRALRVLVTNDDGVGAAGIDAVVEALRHVRGIELTVVAPATNQSGSADKFSSTAITASAATTVHGYPATAVTGFPADAVYLAVKSLLARRPDLVVSGINFGQNIGDLVNVSGTVGAARTARRLGIPAIAVSQGIGTGFDYTYAARLTTLLVQSWRHYLLAHPHARPKVISVNVPTCAKVRGVKYAPVGLSGRVTSYTQTAPGTFQPVVEQRNLFTVDCTSAQRGAKDDIDAFTHGFAAVSRIDGP